MNCGGGRGWHGGGQSESRDTGSRLFGEDESEMTLTWTGVAEERSGQIRNVSPGKAHNTCYILKSWTE